MSGAHTPGPWLDWSTMEWLREPQKLLANTADARLIGAAPDLLAALQAILPGKLCGESWNLPDGELVQIMVTFADLRAARKAIAAATGEGL